MSRVGKRPVNVPKEVTIKIDGENLEVKGPKGILSHTIPNSIKIKQSDSQMIIERTSEEKKVKSLHGLTRALIANMVEGVTKGFEKVLQIEGVGYRAAIQGSALNLTLGFSHPMLVQPPTGITFEVEQNTTIKIKGIDKQAVGEIAAEIRRIKPPEPYKGKGIRYLGEYVRRKEGKKNV